MSDRTIELTGPPERLIAEDGRLSGLRLFTTDHCRVEIHFMLWGDLHIVESFEDSTGRQWRYPLDDNIPEVHLLAVIGHAMRWDGAAETEPEGWVLEVISRRRRPDGDPEREYVKDS